MKNLGYDYEKHGYVKRSDGEFYTHAKPEVIKGISEKMLQIANKYGVKLSTCAEPGVMPGITKQGCLSVQQINNILGTHIEDKGLANTKQRPLCSCYGGKVDVLRYDQRCSSSCVYCYAHHNRDKILKYYNEDGTLKDVALTRANPNDYSDSFQNVNSDNVVVEDVVKPWRSDSSKQNKTRRIYLKGKENKGYFEVVKDLEDNNYSVHFKPTDSKNPNAFTQEEKTILFQAVADVIPDGANLSTWGELTNGGIHGLSRFADLGFTKTGERSAKTKAGEDINIPIFTKSSKRQSALQNKKNNNPQDYTMNSGGAYGGDTYWDVIGRSFGLTNINHFRPIDNQNMSKTLRDKNVKPFSITHEQSNYAREQIKQLTGRELPYTLAGELLARDFYQVDKSDGVFAIANITSSQKAVEGGTNMAVQVGIKQGKPVHVYDLNTESWYQYNQSTDRFEVEDTPVLTKSFAGVGTRNIQNYKVNKNGQWVDREGYVGYDKALKAANAIKAVYQKTFSKNDYKVKNEQEIKDDLKELGKRRQDDCNK